MRIATAVLLLAACAAPEPVRPPYSARPVAERGRWQVWHRGEQLGQVVLLEIQDPSGPLPFYRIVDRDGRWLGHATPQGRFSRRVPFRDGEQDLGVWPMARGVAHLFDAASPVELRAVAVDAVGSPSAR